MDSIFERVCKALHLGIMIAFAVVGTQFDTSDTAENAVVFQQFSCIMMVSKIILLLQYGYVLFWVRGHSKIVTPLLIHMVAFAVGAIVCLGLVFSFDKEKETTAYLAWYAIAVAEALAVFISSSRWRSVSFKRTHLNERVGLLTLIILGEGVIILTKSMTYVTRAQNYSPAIVGQIISSTLIIVSSSRPLLSESSYRSLTLLLSTSSTCFTSTKSITNVGARFGNSSGPSPTSLFMSPLFSCWKEHRDS